jgi:hypothetical protein
VAGNLLPGWTIALLALALLFPVALAAGSGLASAARSPIDAARGFLWAGLRAVPFGGALLVLLAAALVGLLPSPDFPFDPRIETLGTGGTVSVVVALLFYCAVAFFLRPLRPPPAKAVASAAPAALLVACLATLGVWAANPYLGLLVALGLQAWLLAATRPPGGRLVSAGLVLLGLLPLVALVANLAGRFDAGPGVWHDLLLMLADGQISVSVALLGCVLAGSGVAIVAVGGGRPSRPVPEIRLDQEGEISVRRQPRGPEEGPEPGEAEPEDEPEREPGPGPGPQPEPERDPRLWSKPLGWISPPPGRRRATPRPSAT